MKMLPDGEVAVMFVPLDKQRGEETLIVPGLMVFAVLATKTKILSLKTEPQRNGDTSVA
jgi:hypothetical protein